MKNTFNEQLESIMDEKNITIAALSTELSIKISNLYKYKQGTYLPSLENAIKEKVALCEKS